MGSNGGPGKPGESGVPASQEVRDLVSRALRDAAAAGRLTAQELNARLSEARSRHATDAVSGLLGDLATPGGSQEGGAASADRRAANADMRASHEDRDRVVDALRTAAADGRLTAEELDERLETALSARTLGDLAGLTDDLPNAGGLLLPRDAEVKDLVRIKQVHSSAVERSGRWVVPRRMEIAPKWTAVTLDFTRAVITQPVLHVDLQMKGSDLTIITRPGVEVDTDDLQLVHSRVARRTAPGEADAPAVLRVQLVGKKAHGSVIVRPPRRTFWQWLLRKPVTYPE